MAADVFQHKSSTANKFNTRRITNRDQRDNAKVHMLIIFALLAMDGLLTGPFCNCCFPKMHVKRMAFENSWFHLPKNPF